MSKSFLRAFSIVLAAIFFSTAYTATAQAQIRAYRVSDRQVRTLLARIEVRTDDFRSEVDRGLDQSSIDGTNSEDAINSYIADFERATDRLRTNFNNRRDVDADVEEVLNRANVIQNFLRDYRLSNNVQRTWNLLKTDLSTLATYYSVTWNPNYTYPSGTTNTNVRAYRVSDQQVRSLLVRIEVRTDDFRREVDRGLDRSVLNNTNSEDSINSYIANFESATDRLRNNFNSRRDVAADVEEVLNRAAFIRSFLRNIRLTAGVRRTWNLLQTDLSTLASYYNVRWNWNNTGRGNYGGSGQYGMTLTGTYQINLSQSDNVDTAIDRVLSGSTYNNQRDRLRVNLQRRLAPPDTLVIEMRNNQVTIASSLSPQVTFAADGVARTETNPNGRQVSVKATTLGNSVEISYQGDRTNDFFLTFTQLGNGQLRVTRRLYLENRNETVVVNSVYDRISQTADFSRVTVNSTASVNTGSGTLSNDFIIPNGTQLVAVLRNQFSTKDVTEGDRFTMEVTSPSQYDGAIIEGYFSNTQKSGRVSGRAQVTFNFDTIQMPNGNRYRFSGLIDQVRQPNGDTVSVNNEGAVRDGSQTNRTVTRAGIGAAIGAIIGAIAGGGQGAAIGAGIGAGAGAGTVILQGRDNLELQSGAEFRITSSAPSNLRAN